MQKSFALIDHEQIMLYDQLTKKSVRFFIAPVLRAKFDDVWDVSIKNGMVSISCMIGIIRTVRETSIPKKHQEAKTLYFEEATVLGYPLTGVLAMLLCYVSFLFCTIVSDSSKSPFGYYFVFGFCRIFELFVLFTLYRKYEQYIHEVINYVKDFCT